MMCKGHPAGVNDVMGITVYCDGSCRSKSGNLIIPKEEVNDEDVLELTKLPPAEDINAMNNFYTHVEMWKEYRLFMAQNPYGDDAYRKLTCGCCTGRLTELGTRANQCVCYIHQDVSIGLIPVVCSVHRCD